MEETINNIEVKEEVKSPKEVFIEDVIKITTGVFGEDKVESKVLATGILKLVIHFPEILLKSSIIGVKARKEQLLKDVFLKFSFNTNTLRFISGEFRRCTFTYQEIKANYAHSHVSGGINEWATAICQGSTTLAKLQNLLQARYDNQTYEDFLYLYIGWLGWESIEGGPYRKINDINNVYVNNYELPDVSPLQQLESLTNFFKKFDLKLNINTKSDIVNFELDNDYIKSLINETSTLKLYYDEKNNNYLLPSIDLQSVNKEIAQYKESYAGAFEFKNKKFDINIEEMTEILNSDSLVSHPNISNYIISTLKLIIDAKYKNNERVSFIE